MRVEVVAGSDRSRWASALAAAVICLLLVRDGAYAIDSVFGGRDAELPFVVAVFVMPVLLAFRTSRLMLVRFRWPALLVQTLLTWVPFVLFGRQWQPGVGGLLAGLVLLTMSGLTAWLLAGALLAADLAVRAGVVGVPLGFAGAWSAELWAAVAFTDLALTLFGMIRLAQLVRELQDAQRQHAAVAVAAVRLKATEQLQSAVGHCLDSVTTAAVAARLYLIRDPDAARAAVTDAGRSAREAVAQARAVAADRGDIPDAEPGTRPAGDAIIGARVAWVVLVVVLCGFVAAAFIDAVSDRLSPQLALFMSSGIAASTLLQLRHSWAAREGLRPRMWPLTLCLQAMLVYAFFLPQVRVFFTLAPFLAGSVLLLAPARWRWAGYAAVTASWSALYAAVPLHGGTVGSRGAITTLYEACAIAGIGLLVYGLSRLAGMTRELEAVRAELAQMAAVRERLRVARDVHDLLGLGLSAIALKTDLIRRLIGRDDSRASAEIRELGRTCAAARADIRLVASDVQRLSLATELAASRQILMSADVNVEVRHTAGAMPQEADEVLAVVLREAVTNIVRHSRATSCTIEVSSDRSEVRLAVTNDGMTDRALSPGGEAETDGSRGSGLTNLASRVQAAGGRLTSRFAESTFELIALIPLTCAITDPAAGAPESGTEVSRRSMTCSPRAAMQFARLDRLRQRS